MEYLWHLFKTTTLIEWGMFAAAIFFALVLVIVGMVLFFRAKRKLTIAIFLAFTFLPMILCFATIGVRYFDNQRRYRLSEFGPGDPYHEKIVKEDRADYVVAGLIGIVLTAPPFLIGTVGLIKKRTA